MIFRCTTHLPGATILSLALLRVFYGSQFCFPFCFCVICLFLLVLLFSIFFSNVSQTLFSFFFYQHNLKIFKMQFFLNVFVSLRFYRTFWRFYDSLSLSLDLAQNHEGVHIHAAVHGHAPEVDHLLVEKVDVRDQKHVHVRDLGIKSVLGNIRVVPVIVVDQINANAKALTRLTLLQTGRI